MSEIEERKKKKEEELRQLEEKGESYQIFANNKEKNTPSFLAEDIDAEIKENEEVSFQLDKLKLINKMYKEF